MNVVLLRHFQDGLILTPGDLGAIYGQGLYAPVRANGV
jgi:hypothetical protein